MHAFCEEAAAEMGFPGAPVARTLSETDAVKEAKLADSGEAEEANELARVGGEGVL